MTTDPHIAVRFDRVTVAFPGRTLAFDAAVHAGMITAVAGASGSGKSTLLNLVAGFETPDAGHVSILGTEMTAVPPAARPVSVIFQENNLFAHLDVFTNVGLGLNPALALTPDDRDRIEKALSDVGLAGYGARRPPTLSGGERQRVALARALVRRRPILLLDEPFAALDPGLREEMGDLLKALQRQQSSTILLVTHQADDVRRLADRVMFLSDGDILLHEPADVFLARTKPTAVARFLGRA